MTELLSNWLASVGIEPRLALTFFTRNSFMSKPQVGTPVDWSWSDLVEYLSSPTRAESKDAVGGYAPARFIGNIRRKANVVLVSLLVVDVDVDGDVERIADELAPYQAIVTETFSSTEEAPRCRVLLRPDEPLVVGSYERLHRIVRELLRAQLGVGPDDGASDSSRLSFGPVRRPGTNYRFRVCDGQPLPVSRILAAHPPDPLRSQPRVVAPDHQDAYRRGALRRAAEALAAASEGQRHEVLNKESFALARLGLSLDDIESALLPVAVAVMGERRRREAERTIADAVRARRGAAA